MAIELPHDYARCEGASARLMGTPTLAESCTDCLRRTSSRTHERVWFINAPTSWPCIQRITQRDLERYEG